MRPGKCAWQRLWDRQPVRYLFLGGLTVCVNFICFCLLTAYTEWDHHLSNGLSILAALLFAYAANTRFVFRSRCGSVRERILEFTRFFMARLFTMLLEFGGVYFLACVLSVNEILSKGILQVAVILLNYVLSRSMIYRDSKK